MADDEKAVNPPPRAKNVKRRVKAKPTAPNDAAPPAAAAAPAAAAVPTGASTGTPVSAGSAKPFRRPPKRGRKKFGGDPQAMGKNVARDILPKYFLLALGYNSWSFQSILKGAWVLRRADGRRESLRLRLRLSHRHESCPRPRSVLMAWRPPLPIRSLPSPLRFRR